MLDKCLTYGCFTGGLKLCDFGSASTDTYLPDHSWNMSQRTKMEEELAKFTTPMYRCV